MNATNLTIVTSRGTGMPVFTFTGGFPRPVTIDGVAQSRSCLSGKPDCFQYEKGTIIITLTKEAGEWTLSYAYNGSPSFVIKRKVSHI